MGCSFWSRNEKLLSLPRTKKDLTSLIYFIFCRPSGRRRWQPEERAKKWTLSWIATESLNGRRQATWNYLYDHYSWTNKERDPPKDECLQREKECAFACAARLRAVPHTSRNSFFGANGWRSSRHLPLPFLHFHQKSAEGGTLYMHVGGTVRESECMCCRCVCCLPPSMSLSCFVSFHVSIYHRGIEPIAVSRFPDSKTKKKIFSEWVFRPVRILDCIKTKRRVDEVQSKKMTLGLVGLALRERSGKLPMRKWKMRVGPNWGSFA